MIKLRVRGDDVRVCADSKVMPLFFTDGLLFVDQAIGRTLQLSTRNTVPPRLDFPLADP